MKRTKTEYSVVVGNVGQVHTGTNYREANCVYRHYVWTSKQGKGRTGREDVALYADGELVREFDFGIWVELELMRVIEKCKDAMRVAQRDLDIAECQLKQHYEMFPHLKS